MKTSTLAGFTALAGFAIGTALPFPGGSRPRETAAEAPRRMVATERPWTAARLAPGDRMAGLAEKAASLDAAEWPAFFRAQLGSPEFSRLAARLWAESDPAGFWRWLREERDALLLDRFAEDLLHAWAQDEPDAAMAAVLEITDGKTGDLLRRRVVDTVLARDLAKGLELAAQAGDFNRFGWGPRDWMKTDPGAAVRGLAELPAHSDYHRFLDYALPIWVESDPHAALEWMKTARPLKGDEWLVGGFKAAAKADPQAALAAARSLEDPDDRETAIGGVLAGGTLTASALGEVLGKLSLDARARFAPDMIRALPRESPEDFAVAAEVVEIAPANRNVATAVENLAREWATRDWQGSWEWAASLTDAERSRRALASVARAAEREQVLSLASEVARLPASSLSDDLFRHLLQRLPEEERAAWIRSLPADRATWAETAAGGERE